MRTSAALSLRSLRQAVNAATVENLSKTRLNYKKETLHRAIRGGHTQLVGDLLQLGISAVAKGEDGSTPIHLAVKLGHDKITSLLLLYGAEKDALDSKGHTSLHLAAIYGHFSTAKLLLDAGADATVIYRDSSNYEHWALSFAARMGHTDVLKVLVEYGAEVNTSSTRGLTALHYAAVRNQAGTINALVEAGADVESKVNESGGGGTPLHASSVMRCYEATLALLKKGADVQAKNVFGYTPLHGAARQGGKERAVATADLLLRWGADEMAVDRDGNKPIDLVGETRIEEGSRQEGNVERLYELLASAPADKAWRRRGMLVLCRAFPDKAQLNPEIWEAHLGSIPKFPKSGRSELPVREGATELRNAEALNCVEAKALDLAEEDLFREIVIFL